MQLCPMSPFVYGLRGCRGLRGPSLRGLGTVAALSIQQIQDVQEVLGASGYAVDITGVVDAATTAGVTKYQRDTGLPVTGIIDGATWNSMFGTGGIAVQPPVLVTNADVGSKMWWRTNWQTIAIGGGILLGGVAIVAAAVKR